MPPIVKDAESLLLKVEQAVSRFPRRYRYQGVGPRLSDHAFRISELANLAWRQPSRRRALVGELQAHVDSIRICAQLGSRLRAFTSFGQFEDVARTVDSLGRQAGGWLRRSKEASTAQNPPPARAAERGQKLSTRAASREVNP